MRDPQLRLHEGEEVVVSVRAHWISLVMPVFMYVVGLVLSLLFIFLPNSFPEVWAGVSLWVRLFGFSILFLVHHWFFIYLFHWELSRWVVTTKRVIDFKFFPYVKHDAKFIIISDIHEIERHKEGLLRNIFDYGDVVVNHLTAIPQPVALKDVPRVSAFVNLVHALLDQKGEEKDVDQLRRIFYS